MKNASLIVEKAGQITNKENDIKATEANIVALALEIDGLSNSLYYFEQGDKQAEAQKAEIEAQIAQLTAQLEQEQAKKVTQENELVTLQSEKSNLETKKAQFETDKSEIELKIQTTGNEITQKAMQNYNAAKANLDSVKSQELSAAESKLSSANASLEQVKYQISYASRDDAFDKGRNFSTDGEALMRYAIDNYDGKSAMEMYEIMSSNNYQFDGGLWCCDYGRFLMGMFFGEENLEEWYREETNTAWCEGISSNAGKAGVTISKADLQPGDIVMLGGGYEHFAFFNGWADENHSSFYTVERCDIAVGDGVGQLHRGDKEYVAISLDGIVKD